MMRGSQKQKVVEHTVIASAVTVTIVCSAVAGHLLGRILEAWGWIAW